MEAGHPKLWLYVTIYPAEKQFGEKNRKFHSLGPLPSQPILLHMLPSHPFKHLYSCWTKNEKKKEEKIAAAGGESLMAALGALSVSHRSEDSLAVSPATAAQRWLLSLQGQRSVQTPSAAARCPTGLGCSSTETTAGCIQGSVSGVVFFPWENFDL